MLAGGQVFGEDINANRVEEQTSGPPHVFFCQLIGIYQKCGVWCCGGEVSEIRMICQVPID